MEDGEGDEHVAADLDLVGGDTGGVDVVMADEAGDEGADRHAGSTDEQTRTTAHVLDRPHGGHDHGEGHAAEQKLDGERVERAADVLEEDGGVVVVEVLADHLLEKLEVSG